MKQIYRALLTSAGLMTGAVCSQHARAAVSSESCDTESLQAMAPPDVTIGSAVRDGGRVCRIYGHVTTRNPGPNKVLFVLGLPDNFNGRYVYLGVGGAAAYLPALPTSLLSKGYELAGSNAGTGSTSCRRLGGDRRTAGVGHRESSNARKRLGTYVPPLRGAEACDAEATKARSEAGRQPGVPLTVMDKVPGVWADSARR